MALRKCLRARSPGDHSQNDKRTAPTAVATTDISLFRPCRHEAADFFLVECLSPSTLQVETGRGGAYILVIHFMYTQLLQLCLHYLELMQTVAQISSVLCGLSSPHHHEKLSFSPNCLLDTRTANPLFQDVAFSHARASRIFVPKECAAVAEIFANGLYRIFIWLVTATPCSSRGQLR